MLPLKARNITKSVVVAIIAALLCMFIFLPTISVLPEKAVKAIEKAWITDCHARLLIITYGYDASNVITFGISGLLMGVLIIAILQNNRMITTTLALLIVTIVTIIFLLEIIPNIPHGYESSVLIPLSISFLFEMAFCWGCAFLGIWFFTRRKHKTSQQSLPSDDPKAVPPP